MLNLQIKNEQQFLLDGLKTHLKSHIAELNKRIVDATESLEFGMERKPIWEKEQEERFTIWMQSYTIHLRNAQYQLEWYEKQYEELCLEM